MAKLDQVGREPLWRVRVDSNPPRVTSDPVEVAAKVRSDWGEVFTSRFPPVTLDTRPPHST